MHPNEVRNRLAKCDSIEDAINIWCLAHGVDPEMNPHAVVECFERLTLSDWAKFAAKFVPGVKPPSATSVRWILNRYRKQAKRIITVTGEEAA